MQSTEKEIKNNINKNNKENNIQNNHINKCREKEAENAFPWKTLQIAILEAH